MHSIRWNRSRCYIRLGLLLLILIFSAPYTASTLYIYLNPVPIPPPKNDSFSRLSSLSQQLFNNSDDLEDFLRKASVIPNSESEIPKIKCHEDLEDVAGIIEWSRYVTKYFTVLPQEHPKNVSEYLLLRLLQYIKISEDLYLLLVSALRVAVRLWYWGPC